MLLTLTLSALLLLAPAARLAKLPPLLVAAPVRPLKLAFKASVKAPAGPVLTTVSAALALPPPAPFKRWLATSTGVGVAAPAARLKAVPMTCTLPLARPNKPRPLVPKPSVARSTVALPLRAPAAPPAAKPMTMALLLLPGARPVMLPTSVTPAPVLPALALSSS